MTPPKSFPGWETRWAVGRLVSAFWLPAPPPPARKRVASGSTSRRRLFFMGVGHAPSQGQRLCSALNFPRFFFWSELRSDAGEPSPPISFFCKNRAVENTRGEMKGGFPPLPPKTSSALAGGGKCS